MKISIIAAVNPQFIIGINGKIPWHIPEDLKRFKQLTMGKPIIMGRKTWESLGSKPLPGRMNVIVTSSNTVKEGPAGDETVVVKVPQLDAILEFLRGATSYDEVFIIGGERLYAEALPLADRMYLTSVKKEFPAINDSDEVVYFPIKAANRDEWYLVYQDLKNEYIYTEWHRVP